MQCQGGLGGGKQSSTKFATIRIPTESQHVRDDAERLGAHSFQCQRTITSCRIADAAVEHGEREQGHGFKPVDFLLADRFRCLAVPDLLPEVSVERSRVTISTRIGERPQENGGAFVPRQDPVIRYVMDVISHPLLYHRTTRPIPNR